MLILTRKPGESLYIGDDIKITIVEIKGHQIRVGIDAPKEFRIYREEIYIAIQEENRQAAEASTDVGLEDLASAFKSGKAPAVGSALGRLKAGSAKPKESGEGEKDPQVVVKRKRSSKTDE